MNYELSGTLLAKYDTQIISEKFKKREFVVEVKDENSQYANFVKLQLVNAKCEIIDGYNIGDVVKIGFNIRGNRYEKNGTVGYITNLDAWRITKAGANEDNRVPTPQYNTAPNAPMAAPDFTSGSTDIVDDLPF